MGSFKHRLACLLVPLVSICAAQGNLQMGGIEPFGRSNEYLMGTIFFSAVDATIITFNTVRLTKGDPHPSNAPFGLLMGTAQTAYGLMNLNSRDTRTEMLCTANIGFGVATILTSLMRTYRMNRSGKDVTVDLFTLPPAGQSAGAMGLTLTRRF